VCFLSSRTTVSMCTTCANISQIDLRQKVCTPWCICYITNQYIPYCSHLLVELLIQKTTKPLEIKRFALYQYLIDYLPRLYHNVKRISNFDISLAQRPFIKSTKTFSQIPFYKKFQEVPKHIKTYKLKLI